MALSEQSEKFHRYTQHKNDIHEMFKEIEITHVKEKPYALHEHLSCACTRSLRERQ